MRFRVFSTLINEYSDFFIGHARGRVVGKWDVITNIGIREVPQVRGQFHNVPIGIVNHSVTGVGHWIHLLVALPVIEQRRVADPVGIVIVILLKAV